MARSRHRPRDNQRSRFYAWERAITQNFSDRPLFATLHECEAWLAPIWRKERGRLGLARQQAPDMERPAWGQRRALAHDDHRITLPRWARSPWVILHEAAHRLTPQDEAHGPRFVGVLIGLLARYDERDAHQLMRMADAMGVRYRVRSIGAVPVLGPAWRIEQKLRALGPMSPMDLVCEFRLADQVDISLAQVRGAALALIRTGKACWWRKKLALIQ